MKGKVNQLYQNFFIQFRLDFRDNMTQSDSSIKILTSQVQEDGKLRRVIEAYVEEGGRDLICITKFDGQQEIMVSSRIGQKLQKSPHLVHALVLLFGEETEETETKQTLASNKELHLPKLFAPFKDKRRGWHIGTVREQAILYLNCLGYGHGGKSLIDTKQKKAVKPDWFSGKLDFGQYEHPSKASLQSNEFLIEGILNFLTTMSSPIATFPPLLQRSPKNPKKRKFMLKMIQ